MPGFRPDPTYVREMKRFGILPPALTADAPLDIYATDRAYPDFADSGSKPAWQGQKGPFG